jgi:hypothetical protein
MAPYNLVVSNPMVTCFNTMVSLSNHGWCARPSFDPRNKSEGMQAHDEDSACCAECLIARGTE